MYIWYTVFLVQERFNFTGLFDDLVHISAQNLTTTGICVMSATVVVVVPPPHLALLPPPPQSKFFHHCVLLKHVCCSCCSCLSRRVLTPLIPPPAPRPHKSPTNQEVSFRYRSCCSPHWISGAEFHKLCIRKRKFITNQLLSLSLSLFRDAHPHTHT